jgi:hypothetical protein
MKPYDRLTIIRNRHRARDLRAFRELVEIYFERSEVALDDLPVDWEGARAARAQINRMLPRVVQIVHAAGLDASTANTRHPVPTVADVDVLRNIFSARPSEGQDQEILDVIDMATGVYDATRFEALVRTVNPFHYATTLLAFVGRIPVRAFTAVFKRPQRASVSHIGEQEAARLAAVVSRLADMEELIEMRFAEMRDRQSHQFGENAEQMVDLAERLDFAERVIAQQRPMNRLEPRNKNDVVTPV